MSQYLVGRFRGSMAMMLALLLLAACGAQSQPSQPAAQPSAAPQPAAQTEKPKAPPALVRIGYASDPDFTQLNNYKWEEILADKYGYKVEHFFFDGSQVAYKALLAGAVDVVVAALLPAIQVSSQSKTKLKLIAADLQSPDYVLVARPELKKLKDLEGKRLGISTPGDISDTLSRAVLKRENIDVSKVTIVKVGGTGARMAALQANQIDAGMAHADAGLVAASKGLSLLYEVGLSTQGYLQHGLVANENWIKKDPTLTQNVVDGFIDSARWAATDRQGYIELSKKWIKDLPDEVRNQAYDIFKKINMFAMNGGMDEKFLKITMDLEIEAGSLEKAVAFSEWSDPTFAQAYLKANGTK